MYRARKEESNRMNIVFIGSGNVAAHFSFALKGMGHSIIQVFGRSDKSADALSGKLNCTYTTSMKHVAKEADLYIFAVKDDVLQSIIRQTPANQGIWIHTAGSISIDVFKGYSDRYGVIYPLQTLSKKQEVDFRKVPLFIEANNAETATIVQEIAASVSSTVKVIDSERRKRLHLSAVFACNFTNYLYSIAADIVEKQGIDWHVLQPLIDETAHKLYFLTPKEAQTGPAVRNDRNIIEKHLKMIEDKNIKDIYERLSRGINCEFDE
jgi:predicted short-subunit dehydrogenase-like oxidoreductase (DUF2520 family)